MRPLGGQAGHWAKAVKLRSCRSVQFNSMTPGSRRTGKYLSGGVRAGYPGQRREAKRRADARHVVLDFARQAMYMGFLSQACPSRCARLCEPFETCGRAEAGTLFLRGLIRSDLGGLTD